MRVRIISLGDIVTLNITKTIGAFTTHIASKKASSNPVEIGRLIGGVLQANMDLLNNFKLGRISENDFNEQMIAALEQATGVKLSTNEFDSAWNTMLPTFAQFGALLKEAIAFNDQVGQRIIFVSFTNPKDIRHITEQLKANGISYKADGEKLTEIGGITLLTTYANKKSKADLIETTIKELLSNPTSQATLASSLGTALNPDQHRPLETQEIKYIRAVNDLKDPVLKEDVDKTNQEAEGQAASFAVETIIWRKLEQQPLSDVLSSRQIASRALPTSML